MSIEDGCAYISELTGFKATFDLQPTAFGSLAADVSKLQSILGDESVSKVQWRDGVKRLLQHMAPQRLKKWFDENLKFNIAGCSIVNTTA